VDPTAAEARAGLAAALALCVAGLLTFYCFVLSYQLPEPTAASGAGAELPALTLPAHDGTTVDLRAASEGTLVLAFYRGAW